MSDDPLGDWLRDHESYLAGEIDWDELKRRNTSRDRREPLVVGQRVVKETPDGGTITELQLSEAAKRGLSVTPEAAQRFHEACDRSINYYRYRGDKTRADFRDQMIVDGLVACVAAMGAVWIQPVLVLVALVFAWSCGGYTVMWKRTPG